MSSQAANTTPERLWELTMRVVQRSRENAFEWQELRTADAYYTKVGEYYFQVQSEDRDGNHPFRVQIEAESETGGTEILASLSTKEEPFGDSPPRDDWRDVIAELYPEARRKGSSAEKAIDEMLDLLDTGPQDAD